MVIPDDEFTYEWSQAPHWANYAATDFDGDRRWFEQEPVISDWLIIWDAKAGAIKMMDIPMMAPVDNWKESVRSRPPDPHHETEELLEREAELRKGTW